MPMGEINNEGNVKDDPLMGKTGLEKTTTLD